MHCLFHLHNYCKLSVSFSLLSPSSLRFFSVVTLFRAPLVAPLVHTSWSGVTPKKEHVFYSSLTFLRLLHFWNILLSLPFRCCVISWLPTKTNPTDRSIHAVSELLEQLLRLKTLKIHLSNSCLCISSPECLRWLQPSGVPSASRLVLPAPQEQAYKQRVPGVKVVLFSYFPVASPSLPSVFPSIIGWIYRVTIVVFSINYSDR